MLERTFIHCQGIGPSTERKLWSRQIADWHTFLGADKLPISEGMRKMVEPVISESVLRFEKKDYEWFARNLPNKEHWRAFDLFSDNVAYLDIETTGGTDSDVTTVIGMYEGAEFRQFVRGENLYDFPEAVRNKAMLVTFFGSGFDLPVLKREFGMDFPQLHVDLCFLLRRLGQKGGLKVIEERLGMDRSEETTGLGGWDAVRLWQLYRYGDKNALRLLLEYNREDVVNMENLLQWALPRMIAQAGWRE